MSEWLLLILYCAILGSGVGFLAWVGRDRQRHYLSRYSVVFYRTSGSFPTRSGRDRCNCDTSLASIYSVNIVTAIAHHKNGNVPWNLAPWMAAGVALGALVSGFYGGTVARTSGTGSLPSVLCLSQLRCS